MLSDQSDEDFLGTTSDYILIAMITAMMMFMTLCCLCLFCRTTSRCTVCGFDFEVNDEPSIQQGIEDMDEIHEVVPLTPTSNDINLPDIERMLTNHPPPPRYSEVAQHRNSFFRWSRRNSKPKKNQTLPGNQRKTQRSRSLMLRRPRLSIHRSRSYQPNQEEQPNVVLPTHRETSNEKIQTTTTKVNIENENIKFVPTQQDSDKFVSVQDDNDDVFV